MLSHPSGASTLVHTSVPKPAATSGFVVPAAPPVSRHNRHAFLLANAAAVSGVSVEADLHILTSREADALFLRRADAAALELEVVDEAAETEYGALRRLSPVVLSTTRPARGHHGGSPRPPTTVVVDTDVYEMPAAFEGSAAYGGGLVTLGLVLRLGVAVAFDRGAVFLVEPQASRRAGAAERWGGGWVAADDDDDDEEDNDGDDEFVGRGGGWKNEEGRAATGVVATAATPALVDAAYADDDEDEDEDDDDEV
ncbi:hypothetical protein HK405_003838 [Cladochytrium tenue]|nr:hypothetical protein HK405_003838 [Cladochytrium tenue]